MGQNMDTLQETPEQAPLPVSDQCSEIIEGSTAGAPNCESVCDSNANSDEYSVSKEPKITSVPPVKSSSIQSLSRIARPCAGHQKPAVPATPTKYYTLRSLADDFGRQKLTVGSMDTIWETHPHRLNEAGLVRHSDSSVLTEDTDSFIIGDKVWVGGCKPGQIAYIGETQFAPGEWAGIVLDQPIGKNDGSVSGIRYFQCEPKRGVFSRLTRLTRSPFPEAEDADHFTTPVSDGAKHRVGSPLSPTGSTKSLRKSPSLSTSNTSLVSATNHVDFKIGDRVIIKSTQGSKVGTLRYMGATEFALGEWCGIELDEPRGKNDGSVEGVRYFECRPQYGLFSLVTKVSKSPLKYKPGNCAIHSGARLPPSGMKRTGSKESMLSMTSSITSTASNTRRIVTPKAPSNNFPSRSALQVTFKGL
ncbi:restin homolog isoform X3 [Photinus pyralis]|nr:restin homolog isoform X3 [Photinus pyralis]